MATINASEWMQARQWLIDSGVIPPTHRVTKPDVELIDFVRSLRDGVFLCSLLNRLKPGCVEYTARPVMQHSYLNNINAFLDACKSGFNIKDNDLFTDSELYDVYNFQKVMLALSKLSHTQEAINMGWKPFPTEDNKLQEAVVSGDDIYASLKDLSAQSAVYANIQDLYPESPSDDESFGYGDEKIYDSICHYEHAPLKDNDQDEKKKSVIRELYETEKSFINVLETISVDYYEALKRQENQNDLSMLFELSRKTLPAHMSLKERLGSSIESKSSDIDLVAQAFNEAEEGLLNYGMYAAYLPNGQEQAKVFQAKSDTAKVMSAIISKHQQRFPLSDLLPVPVQRVLRYPLLLKELEKCLRKGANHSQTKVHQLEKLVQLLEDVAKYINTTKEQFERIRAIKEVEANIVSYDGPKLSSECGHYHMDGELRIKLANDSQEPKSKWVFLFDKILLITTRKYKIGRGVHYTSKAHHDIADITLIDPMASSRARNLSIRIKVEGKDGTTIEYIAYAKTDQLKFKWRDSITKAKEVICPRAGKKGHHSFELVNFDCATRCSFCQKLLYGCYFQGYRCTECKVVSHPECLDKQVPCSAVRPKRPPHTPVTAQHSLDSSSSRHVRRNGGGGVMSGVSIDSASNDSKQWRLYIATQRYNTIGTRQNTYLTFERGDEITVKETEQDWWEGVVVRTGQRGLVSPNFLRLQQQPQLQPVQSLPANMAQGVVYNDNQSSKLPKHTWYIGMRTRIDAEVALQYSPDGVFLIRESMDRPGEYAVALKWNGMPKHIKIMRNPQTERYYVSDACDFESISDLVDYYHKNTLGISFPGVNTSLRIPYSEVSNVHSHDWRHHSISGSNVIPPPSFPPPHPQLLSPPPYGARDGVWVEAVCDFEGDGAGQLTFQKHDHVKVLNKDTQKLGWWFGECNGRTGLFRSDHTIPLN